MIYPRVQVIVGGTWVSFFRTLVRLKNVRDEIRIHVHVVAHHRWRFPELTQDPTDFGNLGSLIRQAFFHLACNFFCVAHHFFLFVVSHAPIVSDRRRLVKAFPCSLYILSAFFDPLRHLFGKELQSFSKLL